MVRNNNGNKANEFYHYDEDEIFCLHRKQVMKPMMKKIIIMIVVLLVGSPFSFASNITLTGKGIAPLELNSSTLYVHKLARLYSYHEALLKIEDYKKFVTKISLKTEFEYLVSQYFETSLSSESQEFDIKRCPEQFKGKIPFCVFANSTFNLNQAKVSMLANAFYSEPKLIKSAHEAILEYAHIISNVLKGGNTSLTIIEGANSKLNAVRAALFQSTHLAGGKNLTGLLSLQDVMAQGVYDVTDVSSKLSVWSELFSNISSYADIQQKETKIANVKSDTVDVKMSFLISISDAFFSEIKALVLQTFVTTEMEKVGALFDGEAYYDPSTNSAIGIIKGFYSEGVCYGVPTDSSSKEDPTISKTFDILNDSELASIIEVSRERIKTMILGSGVDEMSLRVPYIDESNTRRTKKVNFSCRASLSILKNITTNTVVSLRRDNNKLAIKWDATFEHNIGY